MGRLFQVRWYGATSKGKKGELFSSDHENEKGAKNKARDKSKDKTTFELRAQVAELELPDVAEAAKSEEGSTKKVLRSWTFTDGVMEEDEEGERELDISKRPIAETAAKPGKVRTPEDESMAPPAGTPKEKGKKVPGVKKAKGSKANVVTPETETEEEGEEEMATKAKSTKKAGAKKAPAKKPATKAAATPAKAGSIEERFGVRVGSNRATILKALMASKGKPVAKLKLAEAVYGKDAAQENLGALNMVMKGVEDVVNKTKGATLTKEKDGRDISYVLTA